jgi:hypothetical protein
VSRNASGGPSPPERPAAIKTSRQPDAESATDRIATGPPDDDAAIRRVLDADDAALHRVLRGDFAVRHALRWRPGDRAAEQARTLLAAARVEQRRRHGRDVLADVLDAVRGCGR